mmetsp:Transcript_18707/g.16939  ORF Transcript_18707/g.16939 Transcript_18707/m.16939 type:complete len:407 (-) Transcript_18707:309-1529(-)
MGAGSSSGKGLPPLTTGSAPSSPKGQAQSPSNAASSVKSNGPRKFNQSYTLSKELGTGAFSVVKLGTNIKSNQQAAVKIVSKKKLSPEDLASLMTEIEILDSLDHQHVIKLYETFDEGNDFYIVTELVEGGELFDRIVSKTHYTEKEARDLAKIFIETIAYIHGAGIVHRDLKPENLLLTSPDNDADIKICDFGFAKRIVDLLPDETACGTPGYVAPEILRGEPYSAEVDIWSMGVICYVLLAGYPPFYDEDQRKLFKKIKDGRYYFHDEYWQHVSTEAMDFIRKMLCVNQKNRWTAAQLLEHPWITATDETLDGKDLTATITVLKKYNRKRKFKAAADAIIISNRMKALTSGLLAAAQKLDSESSENAVPKSIKTSNYRVSLIDIEAARADVKDEEIINDLGPPI